VEEIVGVHKGEGRRMVVLNSVLNLDPPDMERCDSGPKYQSK
jgi:hypothetical protein